MTNDELVQYFTDLLIVQYRNKTKARALVGAMLKQLCIFELIDDVKNAYNLETAVGAQLDVIGKYEGIDRYYKSINLTNYFAFTDYNETDPDSKAKHGFSTYDNFETTLNGYLGYDSVISKSNTLDDESFRTLIKLKIIQNYSDHSPKDIDEGIYSLFGSDISMDDPGLMRIVYFFKTSMTPLLQAIIDKKVLPKPTGVGLLYVTNMATSTFCFTSYDSDPPTNGHGFSGYSDYDTTSGQYLSYDQINRG